MNIYYLSPYCLLKPTTNRIFDVRLAAGLAHNGAGVELVYPYVHSAFNLDRDALPAHYGLEEAVTLTQLPTPAHVRLPARMRGIAVSVGYALTARRILRSHRTGSAPAVVISRNAGALLPLLRLRRHYPEAPVLAAVLVSEVKRSARYQRLYAEADAFLAPCSATADDLAEQHGVARHRIFNLLSPIPRRLVTDVVSRESARARLGLDADHRPLVVYTGKVGRSGPVRDELLYLLEAAAALPEYRFLLTGGRPDSVGWFEAHCAERGVGNVTFTGFLDDVTEVRYYQAAADVLVSYYTPAGHDVRYNFPQKIPEYMATGNPVVTPDYPATADVLHAGNAVFVAPEDAVALTAGIRRAVEDRDYAARIGAQARRDVEAITFEGRGSGLLAFFDSLRAEAVA